MIQIHYIRLSRLWHLSCLRCSVFKFDFPTNWGRSPFMTFSTEIVIKDMFFLELASVVCFTSSISSLHRRNHDIYIDFVHIVHMAQIYSMHTNQNIQSGLNNWLNSKGVVLMCARIVFFCVQKINYDRASNLKALPFNVFYLELTESWLLFSILRETHT